MNNINLDDGDPNIYMRIAEDGESWERHWRNFDGYGNTLVVCFLPDNYPLVSVFTWTDQEDEIAVKINLNHGWGIVNEDGKLEFEEESE